MTQNDLLYELQRIQCDLASGVRILGQVQLDLAEESLPDHFHDTVYVLHAFLGDLHRQLASCVQRFEQEPVL